MIMIMIIITNYTKENYNNCPLSYLNNLKKIKSSNNAEPLRGYTSNDYLYLTENVEELIPVNSNFFRNKY